MKKNILIFILFSFTSSISAQVGIGTGTVTPTATLEIVTKNNTSATKALEVNNSATTPIEMLTLVNNGNLGVSQSTPETSALLELKSSDMALLLTRTTTSAISSPINGMIIYDTSTNCIKAYENNAWSACFRN